MVWSLFRGAGSHWELALVGKVAEPQNNFPDLLRGENFCEGGHCRVPDTIADNEMPLPVRQFVVSFHQGGDRRIKLDSIRLLSPAIQSVTKSASLLIKLAAFPEILLGRRKGVFYFRTPLPG